MNNFDELDADIESVFTPEQVVILQLRLELDREEFWVRLWVIICVLQIAVICLQIWIP